MAKTFIEHRRFEKTDNNTFLNVWQQVSDKQTLHNPTDKWRIM